MTGRALELRVGNGRLNAVPSVHGSFPFAARVNELCANSATRPDAIAVELPSLTTDAVRVWMADLGVCPEGRTELPAMLALVGPSDLTRTCSAGDRPTIGLLHLTPSDSIIEAIRCAVELSLPVYGIDLHRAPVTSHRAIAVMEDPLAALGRVDEYARSNQTYAEQVRDPEADGPRERLMASHLKYLLSQHTRVLVVCGLAHWAPLQDLLLDDSVQSTAVHSVERSSIGRLQRVVVHPIVALPHMDRFPALVEAYQRCRSHPARSDESSCVSPIDATSTYAGIMQAADAASFMHATRTRDSASDWHARTGFESFLARLCIVDQRRVPSAATLLTASDTTMSRAYQRQLAEVLFAYPWANPRDKRFSELPVLVPAGPRRGSGVVMIDAQGRRGPEMVTAAWFGGQGDPREVAVPWDWPEERRESLPPSDMAVNWPPIDRLVTALSLQAMDRASADAPRSRIEAFAGGLRDGLAPKPTIRALAQGRNEWFVHDRGPKKRRLERRPDQWDPVVWLFNLGPQTRAEWMVLAEELEEMLPLAQQPDQMRTVQSECGNVVVEQIGFGTRSWSSPRSRVRGGHSMYEWGGILIYVPTHFTLEPTARFVEQTEYRRTPIAAYNHPTSLLSQRLDDRHAVVRLFLEVHGVALDLHDWSTSLIRMAIPFAESYVTVIAPDSYSIPDIAQREATRRGVSVERVSHTAFSRDQLSAISTWYGANAVAGTLGREFPAATERKFGEPASANSDLLPPYWRYYGVGPSRPSGERLSK